MKSTNQQRDPSSNNKKNMSSNKNNYIYIDHTNKDMKSLNLSPIMPQTF